MIYSVTRWHAHENKIVYWFILGAHTQRSQRRGARASERHRALAIGRDRELYTRAREAVCAEREREAKGYYPLERRLSRVSLASGARDTPPGLDFT